MYESLENSDIKTQAKPPPPQQPTPIIPKPVKEGKPRAPPPQTVINKVSAPPADQLYGGTGGLYGGYGGGGGSGNQRQPQAPPRPPKTQPKPNVRGGNNGRVWHTIVLIVCLHLHIIITNIKNTSRYTMWSRFNPIQRY